MSFLRDDLSPDLSEAARSAVDSLPLARTIDEALSVPLPLPFARLTETGKFRHFYNPTGPSSLVFFLDAAREFSVLRKRATIADDRLGRVYETEQEFSQRQIDALSEATTIMAQLDSSQKPAHGFRYYAYMSGRIAHGNYWHLELLATNPEDIVMSVSSGDGASVVPNNAYREILKTSPYANLLDMPVGEFKTYAALEKLDKEIRQDNHPLHARFEEASITLSDNIVYVTSALMPHRQNTVIGQRRVYQKACLPKYGVYFLA